MIIRTCLKLNCLESANSSSKSKLSKFVEYLPEVGQHAEEVLVFFENFIVNNGNLDLLLGNTGLNVLLEHVLTI